MINELKEALGIQDQDRQVMTVVSVSNSKVTLQGNNQQLIVTGNWAIGTRLIVRAGNVESFAPSSGVTIYSD
jgi:hypothetical protein